MTLVIRRYSVDCVFFFHLLLNAEELRAAGLLYYASMLNLVQLSVTNEGALVQHSKSCLRAD